MVNTQKADLIENKGGDEKLSAVPMTEKEIGEKIISITQITKENEADVLKDKLWEDKTNDLEKAGYLSDLDGKKVNFLDIVEYDKEAIFEKLESQKLPAWVVKHLDYITPKAKKLKIVMLMFDREKNEELPRDEKLSESNYIEKMKEFGVRPIKFEEYLQFVSNNSQYLKDKKGYIYMPEGVTSSERYYGRIQSHHNGIGIDRSQSIFYARFPFVIEE